MTMIIGNGKVKVHPKDVVNHIKSLEGSATSLKKKKVLLMVTMMITKMFIKMWNLSITPVPKQNE